MSGVVDETSLKLANLNKMQPKAWVRLIIIPNYKMYDEEPKPNTKKIQNGQNNKTTFHA